MPSLTSYPAGRFGIEGYLTILRQQQRIVEAANISESSSITTVTNPRFGSEIGDSAGDRLAHSRLTRRRSGPPPVRLLASCTNLALDFIWNRDVGKGLLQLGILVPERLLNVQDDNKPWQTHYGKDQ